MLLPGGSISYTAKIHDVMPQFLMHASITLTPEVLADLRAGKLFVRQKQIQERGIVKESDRRIIALLDGDQQKAYAAWQQERMVQRRLRRVQSEHAN